MIRRNIYLLFFLILLLSCSSKKQAFQFEGLKPINGTELYLNAFGEGEPLLIIHGGPGLSHDYFLPQFEELGDNFNLIFYDQRVSGRSSVDVADDSITFDLFVQDIEELRKVTGFKKVNILAHSWGALLAVKYVSEYPGKVDKLILSNPVALSTEYSARLEKIQQEKMSEGFMTRRKGIIESEGFKNSKLVAYEDLFKLSFSLSFYDTSNLENLNFKLYEGFFERNKALQNFAGLKEYNFYSFISELEVEILLIRGKSDLTLLEADVRVVNADHLIVMEESGHFPFVEEKKKYLKVVSNFLKH